MSLTVTITSGRDVTHRFGGTVCGIVSLSAKEQECLQTVSIVFTGRTNAVIQPNQAYNVNGIPNSRCSGCLFRKHMVLVHGRTILERGEHVWPFAFKVPRYAQYCDTVDGTHGFGYFETLVPFLGSCDAEGHLLPPSFQHNGKIRCSVTYNIEVRLIRPADVLLRGARNLETSIPISIEHSDNHDLGLPADDDLQAIRSEAFYLELPDSLFKQTQWMKNKLRHAKHQAATDRVPQQTCKSRICVKLQVPVCIAVKDVKPIKVLVTASREAATVTRQDTNDKPEEQIQLKSFSIDLVQHTMVRANGQISSEVVEMPLAHGFCESMLLKCVATKEAQADSTPSSPSTTASPPKSAHSHVSQSDDASNGSSSTASSVAESTSAITHTDASGQSPAPTTMIDIGSRIRPTLQTYYKTSPHAVVPEFTTYNCFRAYTLQVQMSLSCGGQTKKYKRAGIPIRISGKSDQAYSHLRRISLPCEDSIGMKIDIDHPQRMTAQMPVDVEEELPPYSSRTSN